MSKNRIIIDFERSKPDTIINHCRQIIRRHKEMEQDIFYPWFEKNLNEHEIDQLVKRLKNKYSFENESK